MGQKVVIEGRNELAKDGTNRIFSSASVSSIGRLATNVHWQNLDTDAVIIPFNKITNQTTLNGAVTAGSFNRTIVVTSATGITVGSFLILFDPGSVRYSTFYAIGVAGTTITLDSPLDFSYPDGTYVDIATDEMAVNGSVTEQVFGIRGPGAPTGVALTVDITRIIWYCLCASPVDLSLFGDIAALTRGLLLRHRDGKTTNIFNVKSNAEIDGITLDWKPYAATNPALGQDGFTARLTFGSPSKMGLVQRLYTGEDLEFVVQDDLSAITSLRVMAEGHVRETVGL